MRNLTKVTVAKKFLLQTSHCPQRRIPRYFISRQTFYSGQPQSLDINRRKRVSGDDLHACKVKLMQTCVNLGFKNSIKAPFWRLVILARSSPHKKFSMSLDLLVAQVKTNSMLII
ncbi:hypothetical protein PoB_001285500 [Plakobranchus ocellatus]|uniref:Uncharacterized protein n=1 Tax=Plakobranchus ocellatus TaxID=259542 RepID=A0AAV3YV85_9GAST|nr:hypothetical protein PoB_001285500 [Plakobranchus ocellatus]